MKAKSLQRQHYQNPFPLHQIHLSKTLAGDYKRNSDVGCARCHGAETGPITSSSKQRHHPPNKAQQWQSYRCELEDSPWSSMFMGNHVVTYPHHHGDTTITSEKGAFSEEEEEEGNYICKFT